MNTNILCCVRKHPGLFLLGRRMAGRIHIHTKPSALFREIRRQIRNRHQRIGKEWKPARIALYAGAMLCHRQERRLCAYFRM